MAKREPQPYRRVRTLWRHKKRAKFLSGTYSVRTYICYVQAIYRDIQLAIVVISSETRAKMTCELRTLPPSVSRPNGWTVEPCSPTHSEDISTVSTANWDRIRHATHDSVNASTQHRHHHRRLNRTKPETAAPTATAALTGDVEIIKPLFWRFHGSDVTDVEMILKYFDGGRRNSHCC